MRKTEEVMNVIDLLQQLASSYSYRQNENTLPFNAQHDVLAESLATPFIMTVPRKLLLW